MPQPYPAGIPSEATVEQVSNHLILNHVDQQHGWFYVPTRREEQRLGYDASLQGYKALVIQYKRYSPSGRVDLYQRQHNTLLARFPPAGTPYVFYGVSMHPDYATLAAQFGHYGARRVGCDIAFVDAHRIPMGTPSISFARVHHCAAVVRIGRRGTPIRAMCLTQLARQFSACRVGLPAVEAPEQPPTVDGGGATLRHLTLLFGRITSGRTRS